MERGFNWFVGAATAVVAVLVSWTAAAAEPEAAAKVDMEVFTGVAPKKLDRGSYPGGALMDLQEGWVQLNFMVDPEGRPYEISVEDSLGGEPFERNAIRALERSTFEPAKLNGEPVHSAANLKYTFGITDMARGARREFVRDYGLFTKAIQKGDRAAADAGLAKLVARNLYEDAYRNVALYQYSQRWGTTSEQIGYLQAAIARESSDRYLERPVFVSVVKALLSLNLKRNYLAEALGLWETLQRIGSAKDLEPFRVVMAEVQKIRESNAALQLRGEIAKGTSWFHPLLRSKFRVIVLDGRVAEIKLRCEKRYLFFRFDPTLEYALNRRDGKCGLELVGDPGTQFDLIES